MQFDGSKILVTGASGGIGGQIVHRFRAAGAKVAVADLNVDALEGDAYLPGDLMHADYADTLPIAAADALGGLDVLVNNAGVITRGSVVETADADWELAMGVNVEAPFRISRAAIPNATVIRA